MIDPCLELSRHRLARAREAFADGACAQVLQRLLDNGPE